MGRARTWLRAVFVCLTALAALGSSFPAVRCRCPDGRVLTLCPALAAWCPSCACFRPCCTCQEKAPPGPQAAQRSAGPSCCCHETQATPQPDRQEAQFQAARCVQQVAQAEAMALPAAEKGPADDGPFLVAPAPLQAPALSGLRGALRPSWLAHLPGPPPPDVVTLFQRLLI